MKLEENQIIQLSKGQSQKLAVVDEFEPEPEIKETLAETLTDLQAEFTMELVSSTPTVRVLVTMKSSDLYDPLQIFFIGDRVTGDHAIHGVKYN